MSEDIFGKDNESMDEIEKMLYNQEPLKKPEKGSKSIENNGPTEEMKEQIDEATEVAEDEMEEVRKAFMSFQDEIDDLTITKHLQKIINLTGKRFMDVVRAIKGLDTSDKALKMKSAILADIINNLEEDE